MPVEQRYSYAADFVLTLHTAVVLFIVGGLILILLGGLLRWSWIRNTWFRFLHLGAILAVVLQSLLGMICPLTTLEMWLRARAGDLTYEGSFMAQWLHAMLYYTAPNWVFTLIYVVFGAAVVGAWFLVPPRSRERN